MKDINFVEKDEVFNYRVGAIIRNGNKILVQKSNEVDHATMLGGRVSFGEDSEEAILREIKEETGYGAIIKKEICFVENFFTSSYNHKRYHEILIVYELDFIDKQPYTLETIPAKEEKNKYLEYNWIDINELKKQAFHPFIVLEILDTDRIKHIIFKDNT